MASKIISEYIWAVFFWLCGPCTLGDKPTGSLRGVKGACAEVLCLELFSRERIFFASKSEDSLQIHFRKSAYARMRIIIHGYAKCLRSLLNHANVQVVIALPHSYSSSIFFVALSSQKQGSSFVFIYTLTRKPCSSYFPMQYNFQGKHNKDDQGWTWNYWWSFLHIHINLSSPQTHPLGPPVLPAPLCFGSRLNPGESSWTES